MNLSLFDNLFSVGKWIGLFFGYLFGQSSGALLGFVIGSIFDRAFKSVSSKSYFAFEALKNAELQAIFLDSMFAVMGYIAKFDGRVTEQELSQALECMRRFNLNSNQILRAKISFSHGKSKDFTLDRAIKEINYYFSANRNLLNLFLVLQYEFAIKGGDFSSKITPLNTLFKGLGFASIFEQSEHFTNKNFNQHRNKQKKFVDENPYKILGVSASATQAEIKTAYRRLIGKHHPDRLIARGATKEEIDRANIKTQQIINAYEQLKRE